MKMYKPIKLISLLLIGATSIFQALPAMADAGDTISNLATINYDVGGTAQTPIESSAAGNSTPGVGLGTDTDFVEDRLINFTVAEENGTYTDVSPGQSDDNVVLVFTVTNNGNGTQDFSLSALLNATDPFGGTENFDAGSIVVRVDSDAYTNDGSAALSGYDNATDTATFIDELPEGDTATVYIAGAIAGTRVDDDISAHTLVAQVAAGGAAAAQGADITNDDNGNISPGGTANDIADTAAEETVFNDAAGDLDSTGAAGAAQNGQHADSSAFRVQSAALTVSKVADNSLAAPASADPGGVFYDPVNTNSNPKAIPGGYVKYVVRIANAAGASASATLTTIQDILPAELDLDPDLITNAGPGNPENAAGDGVKVIVNGSTRATTTFFLTGDVADGDGDGVGYTGGAGGTLSINLSTVLPIDVPNGYTAGELQAGESVDIFFNAIVQ